MADPKLEFFTVSDKGVRLYRGAPDSKLVKTFDDAFDAHVTPDGSKLICMLESNDCMVDIIDLTSDDYSVIATLKLPDRVTKCYVSPLGTYLITLNPLDNITMAPNATIWRLSDQKEVMKILIRNKDAPGAWPPVQWSKDENVMTRITPEGVSVYLGNAFATNPVIRRLAQEKVQVAVPSPTGTHVAYFAMGAAKSSPGRAVIWDLSDLRKVCCQKNFFCEEAELMWSHNSEALLIHTMSSLDTSNQSYYGSSFLYYMRADGKSDQAVIISDDAPVHDVKWSPNSSDFVVVHGPMPPSVTLFDGSSCTAKVSYGKSSRNTVEWDPFGRFLLSGGFGNMMGDIDVWHVLGGQTKPIGQTRANCTVSVKWSPCGRYFLCNSTFPRRKTDNFVSMRYYDAMEVFKLNEKTRVDCEDENHPDHGRAPHFQRDLFAAFWRPTATSVYQDRKPTPLKQRWTLPLHEAAKANPVKPAGVYRPPGAQGHSTLAEEIRNARGEGKELKVTNLTNPEKNKEPVKLIPGMSASQAKNFGVSNNNNKKK